MLQGSFAIFDCGIIWNGVRGVKGVFKCFFQRGFRPWECCAGPEVVNDVEKHEKENN